MRTILLLALVACVTAWNRPAHWSSPCTLCGCFVEYTDRDVALPLRPIMMALEPYETTEDRCLATCLREPSCKAAVFGMVGGRNVFTCEFYEEMDPRNSPKYAPFVNMYIKRSKCETAHSHLPSVLMIEADDSSVKRREKHEKMINRPNYFNRG